jgi:hypothetical protein
MCFPRWFLGKQRLCKLLLSQEDWLAEWEAGVMPHRVIICTSSAYFFISDMSFLVLNMQTHVSYQIGGRIKSR